MSSQTDFPKVFESSVVWDPENHKYDWVQVPGLKDKYRSPVTEEQHIRFAHKSKIQLVLTENINKQSVNSPIRSPRDGDWAKEWLLKSGKINEKENVITFDDIPVTQGDKKPQSPYKSKPKNRYLPAVCTKQLSPKKKNYRKVVITKLKYKHINSPVHMSVPQMAHPEIVTDRSLKDHFKLVYEILSGHDIMTTILSTRLLRLRAARVTWHQNPESLVSYILQIGDLTNTVDLLPILTRRLSEDPLCLSVGFCLKMLSLQAPLLSSRYEDYIRKSLDFLLAIVTKCRAQDSTHGVSGYSLEITLLSLLDLLSGLTSISGKTGHKAKLLMLMLADFSKI